MCILSANLLEGAQDEARRCFSQLLQVFLVLRGVEDMSSREEGKFEDLAKTDKAHYERDMKTCIHTS